MSLFDQYLHKWMFSILGQTHFYKVHHTNNIFVFIKLVFGALGDILIGMMVVVGM